MILPSFIRPLLAVAGALYGCGARVRGWLYERAWLTSYALPAPVISVGNLTVGGTGKTPCVAWLVNWLQKAGYQTAILSRGYQRASTGRVLVSNGKQVLCDVATAGDEPYLLAQSCPGAHVLVDAKRAEAGIWLAAQAKLDAFVLDAFVLDDGYQHLRVRRDLNLLLIDATDELAQARVVPHGRLREPLKAMLRADIVIVTRADQLTDRNALEAIIRRYVQPATPVFYARHQLVELRLLTNGQAHPLRALAGQRVAAFTGIARPAQFFADVQASCDVELVSQRAFPDHHSFTVDDVQQVVATAQAAGAQALIVTEKDAVKLAAPLLKSIALPVYATRLEFVCDQAESLQERLAALLQARTINETKDAVVV